MRQEPSSRIERDVARAIAGERRLLLAVSGGADSLALLHAVGRTKRPRQAIAVATVDHGTGDFATAAAAIVREEAGALGLPVHSTVLAPTPATEAAWRTARWRFLREVAARERSRIVTAHSRDDQLETVVMRAMRDAGARGLAGLYAPSDVLRPLIDTSRRKILDYARRFALPYVDDPTNDSAAYLRNRVRRDLLPAIAAARPRFAADMHRLARRAAALRVELDVLLAPLLIVRDDPSSVELPSAVCAGLDDRTLAMLWGAVVARTGVALDRRGALRLARFAGEAGIGARAQFSGAGEVVRTRTGFLVRAGGLPAVPDPVVLAPAGPARYGAFRFEATPGANLKQGEADQWTAVLPRDRVLRIRAWAPGDRMVDVTGSPRRVKRFFADAGIVGPLRGGWPVVLVDDEVAWIPGVRKGRLATATGRDLGTTYLCEHYPD